MRLHDGVVSELVGDEMADLIRIAHMARDIGVKSCQIPMKKGYVFNCYVAAEALYHIVRREMPDWADRMRPMHRRLPSGDSHWWLEIGGRIFDPTKFQFGIAIPDYSKGRGKGFLTLKPSKRAQQLIDLFDGIEIAGAA